MTLVLPPLFALALVALDNSEVATFLGFGIFAMLVFADFGGPLARRFGDYLGLTAIGAVLIALATLLSGSPWAAAAAMAVVAFAITFAGVFGGAFAAGAPAAMLAFVLAVTIPADAGDIPDRLAGWVAAGIAAAVAAIVLWPRAESMTLRLKSAAAAERLSSLVARLAGEEADAAEITRAREDAASAVNDLERTSTAAPYRPDTTTRGRALAYLVDELVLVQQTADMLSRKSTALLGPAERRLALATASTLLESSDALRPGDGRVGLDALAREREVHDEALDSFVSRAGESGERRMAALDDIFLVRILAFGVFSAAANAVIAASGRLPPLDATIPPLVDADPGGLGRLRSTLVAHASLDSVWLRSGIRTGLALGAAVLVATLGQVDHAFWVALATMSVLKSNATGTRHTAWQSLLGTLAGFGIATAFLAAGGASRPALWVALPICVFLSAFTPTAVHFAVGQASFTLFVVVLFNLIVPQGWRTGLIRVEDIAIGAATALVIGGLLWPRGAGGRLRETLAELYAAAATSIRAAAEAALGRASADEAERAAADAGAATRRASDAFATYLNEQGPKRVPVSTWSRILTAGQLLWLEGLAVDVLRQRRGPVRGHAGPAEIVAADAVALEGEVAAAGRSLIAPAAPPQVSDGAHPRQAVTQALGAASPADAREVLMLAWIAAWIDFARRLLDGVAEPIAQVAAVEARPWWR